MDFRRLRYFVAVAEEGHVTRAAERLGIQQAPLSQQIKVFEGELGAKLFHRRPRGVELTDAGRTLLDEARVILARTQEAETAVRRAARGEAGRLRIGLTNSACFHPAAPAVIRAFAAAASQVGLSFEIAGTSALIERLATGDVDVAFVRTAAARQPGLSLRRLAEEPMVAALPAGHPLAASDAVALSDLAVETFVGYPRAEGAGLYDAVIAACHGAGFSPRIGFEAPQMIATLSLVAAGLGVSIVPESLRRMGLDGIEHRPLRGPAPIAELNLAFRAAGASAVVKHFVSQAGALATAAGSPLEPVDGGAG
jgi:DNA-binding transcriptional LysR family regulator